MEFMKLFNSREQAIAIYAILGLVYVVWKKEDLRTQFVNILAMLANWKILASIVGMGLWTIAVVTVLDHLGVWTRDLLKDTILWFLFSGLVTAFSSLGTRGEFEWRTLVAENVGVVVVLEAVLNTYTFPLAGELVLVPVAFFAGGIDAYARYQGDRTDRRISTGVLTVLGTILLVVNVVYIATHWSTFLGVSTLREGLLHPVLFVGFIPCMYLIALISKYERLFLQLDIWTVVDEEIVRYAKWRLIRLLGFRLSTVEAFEEWMGTAVPNFDSREHVDEWLQQWSRD